MAASRRREKPLLSDYDGLDAAQAIAVIDSERRDMWKAVRRDTPNADGWLAIELRLDELRRMRTIFTDRQMAQSMSAATISDAAAIAAIYQEEDTAKQDHEMALALESAEDDDDDDARSLPKVKKKNASVSPKEDDTGFLSILAARHVSVSAGRTLLPPLTADDESKSEEKDEEEREQPRRECVICTDEKYWFEVLSVPCGHDYCTDCLEQLFRDSYIDESLFPPKCCRQIIPITGPKPTLFIPKELIEPYEVRRIETTTTNRTYCVDCTKFIPPTDIVGRYGTCTSCQATTCPHCKKEAHPLTACRRDRDEELVLQLAAKEGWRACYRCRRMIELNTGCYHMRCLCGAQFCYVCGAVWKTCKCPQWDEERLLDRAEQIANRDRLAPAEDEDIQAIANRLLTEHDCRHAHFRRLRGRYDCEECHCALRHYIYECRQCRLAVCRRCRMNRTLV